MACSPTGEREREKCDEIGCVALRCVALPAAQRVVACVLHVSSPLGLELVCTALARPCSPDMSSLSARFDSTHSSLDCYIGSILLALSQHPCRSSWHLSANPGPRSPTLQPPPHTVRPSLFLQANFLRPPLRALHPRCHAACPSWLLLSTFQTPRTPSTWTTSIQSLYNIGFHLDYLSSRRCSKQSTNHKLNPESGPSVLLFLLVAASVPCPAALFPAPRPRPASPQYQSLLVPLAPRTGTRIAENGRPPTRPRQLPPTLLAHSTCSPSIPSFPIPTDLDFLVPARLVFQNLKS